MLPFYLLLLISLWWTTFFFCTFFSNVKDYSLLCLLLFSRILNQNTLCVSCAGTLWTKQTKTPLSLGYRLRVCLSQYLFILCSISCVNWSLLKSIALLPSSLVSLYTSGFVSSFLVCLVFLKQTKNHVLLRQLYCCFTVFNVRRTFLLPNFHFFCNFNPFLLLFLFLIKFVCQNLLSFCSLLVCF